MTVTEEFIALCQSRGQQAAFVYRGRTITYNQLLSDIYRMMALFKSKHLAPGDKVLVLVLPSYELYLLLFAGLCYGLNLVVMDSYRDKKRMQAVLQSQQIRWVFCTGLTALAKPLIGKKPDYIKIGQYVRFPDTPQDLCPDPNATVLTTFTSGTTGEPKPICRSITDLHTQIRIVSNNIQIHGDDIVFSMLPIYTLFVIFSGMTCVIDSRIRPQQLKAQQVTAVLAPIAKLLQLSEPLSFVKRVSIGGAILYPRQIDTLLSLFPNAAINYVYGSSECVLMAKTDLCAFRQTYAFQNGIDGIALSIVNADANGVGQVCVSGDVVLSDTKTQITNDLGFLDEYGLHIVGRRRFSALGRYNYRLDRRLLSTHPEIQKGFSFVRDGVTYFCYEGRLTSAKEPDVRYIRFRKLPMDAKHKTKLDYQKTINRIK